MGQTLSSAAQWTSVKDTGRGKLEFTPVNENILNKIVTFIEGFSSNHPEESKINFKHPLTWNTNLDMFQLSSGYVARGDEIVSESTDGQGRPYLTVTKKDGKREISVSSFEYLGNVLKMAGNNKIHETKICLEANYDPVAKILGDRFANISGTDSSTYRYMEEIMKDQSNSRDEAVEKKKILKLLLLLKDFDEKLLREAAQSISSETKLRPADVEHMYGLLKKVAGSNDEIYPLQDISWTDPHTVILNNGCRAPFWRQLNGDIAYMTIRLHDAATIYITASKDGYYLNGGPDPEKNELIFEKCSNYYKDLITILKEKSLLFATLIQKQEIFLVSYTNDKDVIERSTEENEKNEMKEQRKQSGNRNRKKNSARDNKQTEKKKPFEPSLRWKNLQLESKEHAQVNEKGKMDGRNKKMTTSSSMKENRREIQKRGDGESSFEESSSESEDEEEVYDRRPEATSDLPSEYWQIQKLVKYLKGGNQTATVIALCSLRDFNLSQENCQLAIRDVGGLEVLINLLDTDEPKSKIGSLKILREISQNPVIRRAIADLGGLQTMVRILCDTNKELKCLAAETIANVAKFRRARRTVRRHGGIKRLVALLDCSSIGSVMTAEEKKDVEVARCGALALWSCSKSTHNKKAMRKAGAIPLLGRLLKSQHSNMLIPVVGTLQECASEPSYRLAIRTEGMIEGLVRNLKSENSELQMHCASAIFKCAADRQTRDLIRQYDGLEPLVALLNNTNNKDLLAAATGAIWKCAISPENVKQFQELKTIEKLVAIIDGQPEQVLINVVGALAELAKDSPNRMAIRKAGGIPPLINLLTGTNHELLVNVTTAIGRCAEEPENMIIIDKLDGVRLLWSLLKNRNPEVQASAAWALCPCIENAKDSGEMVRSFVGGLELIVSLLKSDDNEVLAAICAAIANIAKDEENLAVITDHGVVPMLAHLTNTNDDQLRRHLAEAIARCCNWGNNRVSFGHEDSVTPLVHYLKSPNTEVHRTTARALHQLSKDPDNCIAMHEAGVVKPLLQMIGSDNVDLQEAAAGCIANIRRLALANEKARKR